MHDITIVGFGPGAWSKMTLEVHDILMGAERIISRDPFYWEVLRELVKRGKRVITLSSLYLLGLPGDEIYPLMVDIVIRTVKRYGPVVYALPGNPMVFEFAAMQLRHRARQEGLSCWIVEGMSCLDTIFVSHNIDPGTNLQILNFYGLDKVRVDPQVPALIFQVGLPSTFLGSQDGKLGNLEALKRKLLKEGYSERLPVFLLKPSLQGGQISVEGRLSHIHQFEEHLDPACSMYLPPAWLYA